MNATTHGNVIQALWLGNGFVVVCPFVAVGKFAENVTHAAAVQESALHCRFIFVHP